MIVCYCTLYLFLFFCMLDKSSWFNIGWRSDFLQNISYNVLPADTKSGKQSQEKYEAGIHRAFSQNMTCIYPKNFNLSSLLFCTYRNEMQTKYICICMWPFYLHSFSGSHSDNVHQSPFNRCYLDAVFTHIDILICLLTLHVICQELPLKRHFFTTRDRIVFVTVYLECVYYSFFPIVFCSCMLF